MKIVIGIDVGISTTKIVGIDDSGTVISPIRIKATDPVTSLYGAFGKYLYDNNILALAQPTLTPLSTDCLRTKRKNLSPTDWEPAMNLIWNV